MAFAATYTSSVAAFSEPDFRQIVLLGGAVNISFLLAALLLNLRFRVIANAFLTLVVLAGAATAHIIHTDLYLTGNRAVLILLCAAFTVGLFVAFKVIDKTRWGGVALSAAALLGLGIVVGGHWASSSPVAGDPKNIRHITFQETPNLYFVSFESMVPRALLDKHLDMETTGFHDLFEAKFRRFPNFFSNGVRTTHSLSILMALDGDIYYRQRNELKDRGGDVNPYLFAGRNPSPLLDILRRNGYETTSIYKDGYLGRRKGPYIDNYFTIHNNTVCSLLDAGIRDISFWGCCRFFGGSKLDQLTWETLSAEQVTKVNTSDGPQFVIAHMGVPTHTGRTFQYDNAARVGKFRAKYFDASERAAGYLRAIIRHLEEKDPNAILLVYGDHGPFLSRGVKFEDNPEFVVQDNYGVLGGVYPDDACAPWFDAASAQGYMTALDAVHAVLRCLSDGEGALVEPRQFRIRGRSYGSTIPSNLDYEEFLYE